MRALFLLLVCLAVACGGPRKPAQATDDSNRELLRKNNGQAVTGHLVASVGDHTIGPFLARYPGDRGGFATWIGPAEGSGRRVVGVPLGPTGEPRSPDKLIAKVGVDATILATRAMRTGFAVAWAQILDRGEQLSAACVGDDGAPRNKAVELVHTSDHIVWVDVVPTDIGAVVVWAEETHAGGANLLAVALDTDGKVRGVPSRIAKGVSGWHALAVAGGVGVSYVEPVTPRGGTLLHVVLDGEARPTQEPTVIVKKPVVSGDIEVARDGGRLVFGWTDRSGEEPVISIASAGEAPKTLVVARGGAALIGFASGPTGLYTLFESPVRKGDRNVHVARISRDLALEPNAFHLLSIGRGAPELAATATGAALVANIRDCDDTPAKCLELPVVPAMFRFDAKLGLVQREVFSFGTDPAGIAWNLSCSADTCFSLAASGAAPSRIRVAEILARANVKAPEVAAPKEAPPEGSHVSDVAAILSGESIHDMAMARFSDVTILATLGTKADGKPEKGMTLSTRVLDANGVAKDPFVITTRAMSVGGVAIAPAEKPEEGGAIAWVARENGDPEVHVTRIDKRGKRTNDVQLTTTKGDASDVAIAWAGGGWIVAWVDGRDGNGEVYATRVGMDLNRVAREERLTNAPGDASDLVALARGSEVWLAWADPRESARDGVSDIFVTSVRTRDAKRANDEVKVLGTAAHSRSPQLASAGDSVHVAWIEGAPAGLEADSTSGTTGAMWAMLDAKGKVAARAIKLTLGEGSPTALTVESVPGALRGVVARSKTDGIALDAIEIPTGAMPKVSPLLMLDGPPSLDVTLALQEGILFFNDDGPTAADKRARRARIVW